MAAQARPPCRRSALVEDEGPLRAPADRSGIPRRSGRAARYRRRCRARPRTDARRLVHQSSRCWRRRSARRRASSALRQARMRSMSIVGIAADLELELAVALGAVGLRRAPPSRAGVLLARWRDRAGSSSPQRPPSSVQTGCPAALPRMSQQATSIAGLDVRMPAHAPRPCAG